MVGKELEKEAKEYARQNSEILVDNTDAFIISEEYLEKGYLAAAERIAELEMTVGTLRTFSNEQATSIEKLKEECDDLCDSLETQGLKAAELEKENAELNNFIMQSKKDGISPINALIIKNFVNQLVKAKEIIKGWLGDFYSPKAFYDKRAELVEQSEQFLKE